MQGGLQVAIQEPRLIAPGCGLQSIGVNISIVNPTAENRILLTRIEGRLRLTDPERITLAKLGKPSLDVVSKSSPAAPVSHSASR
ncbi:MAG: hypothetical protein A2289_17320 [Deltaproteobacteria bacterium RIFOXYA12_FULL_58_15]|nr:MAG: hypothetical protein A2289_17320 [Deltaproteobacteria bacterium RIFOXYA12_FULL_58_15]OGR09013.1 MAG: hypothetical protein A2341_26085 [Deltaproteobacteria bacterium RIFOXYB12_FULL_58_9]